MNNNNKYYYYNININKFKEALKPLSIIDKHQSISRIREYLANALNLKYGLSIGIISEIMNRHPSTIYRILDNYTNNIIHNQHIYDKVTAEINIYLKELNNIVWSNSQENEK